GTGSTSKGLARNATTPKKNTCTTCMIETAQGLRGLRGAVTASSAVWPLSSQAHSRIEPSSAAHSVTTFTQVGEAMREVVATYDTEKSSVRSAACMTAT